MFYEFLKMTNKLNLFMVPSFSKFVTETFPDRSFAIEPLYRQIQVALTIIHPY